jgi:hypothetical protein
VAFVNSKDYPSRYSQEFHWRLFAPRLGLAYGLTNKTVLRVGYGIFSCPTMFRSSRHPGFLPSIKPRPRG